MKIILIFVVILLLAAIAGALFDKGGDDQDFPKWL